MARVTLRFCRCRGTVGASLRAGDLVEATGTVETDGAGWVVVVDDAADVVTAGQGRRSPRVGAVGKFWRWI